MKEASNGKDTMTGHWEIMGLNIKTPFRVFPDGFPDEIIEELEKRTGQKNNRQQTSKWNGNSC